MPPDKPKTFREQLIDALYRTEDLLEKRGAPSLAIELEKLRDRLQAGEPLDQASADPAKPSKDRLFLCHYDTALGVYLGPEVKVCEECPALFLAVDTDGAKHDLCTACDLYHYRKL